MARLKMIKKFLPNNLLGRAMLIVIFPIVVFQIIILSYYFNSLWERTLFRLSRSVAMEIAMIINQFEKNNLEEIELNNSFGEDLLLIIKVDSKENSFHKNISQYDLVLKSFQKELNNNIKNQYILRKDSHNKNIVVTIKSNNKFLEVHVPEYRITTSRNHIFLGWIVISSSLLILISFLFLRNQVKPITKLARAAEQFGKGQNIKDLKVSGASEVKLATTEFMKMKNRITKQIEQRSLMLAGVSHDLKTPLTRMRLQSETIQDDKIKNSLNEEIKHMDEMLSEYLNFASEQKSDSGKVVNPIEAIIKIISDVHFKEKNINLEILNDEESAVNENIFIRCITNILNNAIENSTKIEIKAEATKKIIKINIHDNGSGIPDDEKLSVFKPFYRIDKSRNQNINNSGLGLATTKSLLSSINGKINLHDSFLGGLEVAIEIQN